MKYIVKKKGHLEKFDERKLYASCYASFLAAQMPHDDAHNLCGRVCIGIKKWLVGKDTITAHQLAQETIKHIRKHNKEAAFMYETHEDIS